jgi:hypothetical protein
VKEEAEIWWIRGGGRGKRKRFNGNAAEGGGKDRAFGSEEEHIHPYIHLILPYVVKLTISMEGTPSLYQDGYLDIHNVLPHLPHC